jgi:hypothetical protein
MKIEGVPNGYELVRIGIPKEGELYLFGRCCIAEEYDESVHYNSVYAIVRKIEKPKQYRPFANAEEFKPHRDRWCRINVCDSRVQNVTNERVCFRDCNFTWEKAYIEITFDDGSPFGVEVSERLH